MLKQLKIQVKENDGYAETINDWLNCKEFYVSGRKTKCINNHQSL